MGYKWGDAFVEGNEGQIMTEPVAPHVVVIDDYEAHLDVLVTYLERAGFTTTGFLRARDALHYVLDHPPSLVVINLYMPEMDGIELSRRLHASLPHVPLIGITGSRDRRSNVYLKLLRDFGARISLHKPVDSVTFVNAVRSALA